MASLSGRKLAEWLEQVADALDSGADASSSIALATPLPKGRSEDMVAAFREGAGWNSVFADAILALSDAEYAILTASEKSARLPQAMRKIAESRRETQKVKRRVALGIGYALFLLHLAALVFSVTYLVSGDTNAFLVSVGMVIVPTWMFVFFVWSLAVYWPSGLLAIARWVPVVSSYRKHWESGVLCDVLANCLSAGMGVVESWEAAAAASGNPKHLALCSRVTDCVQRGSKASDAMGGKLRGLPAGFRESYRSGEANGKLDQNLEAAASRYRADARNKLLLAGILYPKFVLVGIFGYIAYKIVVLVGGYYDQLMEINA